MKTLTIITTSLAGLLATGVLAQDCRIENAKETRFGTQQSVEGTCSNNGLQIQCTDDGNSVQCSGPNGEYSGTDMDALVFSACGCTQ